jgi:hypothetical protein
MGKFKNTKITRSNIISITGAGMYEFDNYTIGPVQKGGSGNTIVSSGSGAYDGGDRVIGFHNGYDIDGDILMTAGWGDGVAFRRLNNDGSMTKLYHDNYALYRDTTSTYNHMQSVAMAKSAGKAVVMSYNVYGYSIFDYRGAKDGTTNSGEVIREARPSHTNPTDFIDPSGTNSRSNGYVRRVGYWYAGGLVAAGNWVYASEHDGGRHYKKFPRRNLSTGTQEFLDGAGSDRYSGSAANDRNGYRAFLSYDEVNDRVYYLDYEGNGAFTVILDASTSTPETLYCDLEDTVAGSNSDYTQNGYCRESGLFVPDPASEPNVVIIPGYDYVLKVDYTNCFSGSAPYVTDRFYIRNYENGIDLNSIARFGTKFQKTSGTPMDKMPGYAGEWVPMSGDRGYGKVDGGFLDLSTFKIYNVRTLSNYQEDTSSVYGGSARGRSWQSDYGVNPVLMSSANGTKYWIRMGYGGDGHSFRIWSEATNPTQLCGNWEVVFGTFTLDNSAKVDMVFVGGLSDFVIPSNCGLSVYVSNNNGTNWETYDKDSGEAHVFSTTGTQLRVKLTASGHPNKAPFLQSKMGLVVDFGSMHDAAKDTNIKYKVTRKKLR